jgi:hypothetical protein
MHKILTFEEYLAEEMKYYDDHPEEKDDLEAHSNGSMMLDIDYSTSS